jgi:hypothetical protein
MLKMAGVQTHPAIRILIGVVIGTIGLASNTTAPLIIGGVLVAWGILAVLTMAVGDGGERRSE